MHQVIPGCWCKLCQLVTDMDTTAIPVNVASCSAARLPNGKRGFIDHQLRLELLKYGELTQVGAWHITQVGRRRERGISRSAYHITQAGFTLPLPLP